MGWMSWSRFFCEIDCERHPTSCINEELYKAHADRLVEDGFKDVSYQAFCLPACTFYLPVFRLVTLTSTSMIVGRIV